MVVIHGRIELRPNNANKVCTQTLVDTVVAVLVGTGKRRLVDCVSEPKVIENLTVSFKAQTDVTEGAATSNMKNQAKRRDWMAFYRSFVNQICPVLRYYVKLEEI